MKLTNLEVKRLQEKLHDIIQNIGTNLEMAESENEEIAHAFIQPIMNLATEISDKVFIQTKDTVNEVKI